jgi:hypothetical protein
MILSGSNKSTEHLQVTWLPLTNSKILMFRALNFLKFSIIIIIYNNLINAKCVKVLQY